MNHHSPAESSESPSISLQNQPQRQISKEQKNQTFIASIYHPWEPEQYDSFNSLASSLLTQAPSNAIKIIGHDLNASVGIRSPSDLESRNNIVGPFELIIDMKREKPL
jgi:hypothetical protein